jgi:hypothetical protein
MILISHFYFQVYDDYGNFILDGATGSKNPGSISIQRSTLKLAFTKNFFRDHGSTIYNWRATITAF